MPVPELTPQQRATALASATEARRARAQVRRRLACAEARIGDIIAEGVTSPAIARMRVLALLESMPGVGPVTAGRIMDELGIARSRRVRGLGDHQARALVDRFGPA